jgi:hypothetical protein
MPTGDEVSSPCNPKMLNYNWRRYAELLYDFIGAVMAL